MKKIFISSLIALSSLNSFASCPDLSGQFSIKDGEIQCKIKRNGPALFVQGDISMINLMAKPGPRYGYLLQRIGFGDMAKIEITSDNCSNIRITSATNNSKSLMIEAGKFDYFGAKSPIQVTTKIDDKGVMQKMLITKFTTIANGVKTVYKNLKYSSSISLNEKNDLVISAGVVYGKRDRKSEKISCVFTRD